MEELKQKILDDFDSEINKIQDTFCGDDGYDEVQIYLKSDSNFLCRDYIYPDSLYELDPEKVKQYITKSIDQAVQQDRERTIKLIKEKGLHLGYANDIINLLQANQ